MFSHLETKNTNFQHNNDFHGLATIKKGSHKCCPK